VRRLALSFIGAALLGAGLALAMDPTSAPVTWSELADTLTRPVINWMGAHPGTTLAALLAGLAAGVLLAADLYCSWKIAGLKAQYPRPTKVGDPPRPPEIAARLARLDFLVRTFGGWYRRLCNAPLIGRFLPDLPEREEDSSVLGIGGNP